jgi:hypothetical protein
MSYHHNPRVVTNGLVLYLDAGNRKSYSGSGTVWNDLSGNNYSGSLVNGPIFNSSNFGSIVFDGIDDRVSRSESINVGSNFTVSVWIYPTILGTTRRGIVGNSYNYSGRNGWFLCTAGNNTNNAFFLSIGNDIAARVTPANTLTPNEWVYISAICENGGSNILLYKNGNVLPTYSSSTLTSGIITYTIPQFNIGFRHVGGTTDPYTGNISIVSLYNRVLSSTEILQNYNATKSRFGL